MKRKIIIGVAGMPGSGKAEIKRIAEAMEYSVVVMGNEIREEAQRRGLEPTPENIGKIMLKLREKDGPTAVAKRCIPKITQTKTDIVCIDGIRSLDEVNEFKKHFSNFTLIAIHSSPETRFQRLFRRKRSDDPDNWNVFLERDLRELSVGQGNVIAMADHMIVNEGKLEEFKTKIRQVLEVVITKWME
jgi:dephospho-CoA kinase